MSAFPASCRVSIVLLAVALLSGCSMAIERSRVANAFAAQFDCPGANVSFSPGGYRVEGCNTTAFYHCSQPRYADNDSSGRDAVSAIVGLLDLALSSGDCMLEHHRSQSTASRARAEPGIDRASLNRIDRPSQARVRGRVRVLGGQLELLAIPGKYPDHVLLTVHGDHRLDYEGCTPWLVRDSQPVRFTAQHARPPYELSLVVPVEQLGNIGAATRFGGEVCGLRFELGERERQLLENFELRRHNVFMQSSAQAAAAHAARAPAPPASTR